MLWVNGLFSSVPAGLRAVAKLLSGVPGVQDIEIVHGTAFICRQQRARLSAMRDGIYALPLSGGKPIKLKGAPKDFHPRGISTFRSPDGGGVSLLAVNRPQHRHVQHATRLGSPTPRTAPALVAQGTIGGGLLTDPQDVVAPVPALMSATATSSPLRGGHGRDWA